MGIKHIEALLPDEFIDIVSNFNRTLITEKIDGAKLTFGFDENNQFYTSREDKGGDRYYSLSDFPNIPSCNAFKGVHDALQQVSCTLFEIIGNNRPIDVEVLYGRQPNSIVYGLNHIVLLPPPDSQVSQTILDQIVNTLSSPLTAIVNIVKTHEGQTLEVWSQIQEWRISTIPKTSSSLFSDIDISDLIYEFTKWLDEIYNNPHTLGMTRREIINCSLSQIYIQHRYHLKLAREELSQEATLKFKLPIKKRLVKFGLQQIKPQFRNVNVYPYEDYGIEGVVVYDPLTNKSTKIVDRDTFTTINEFYYLIRNQIKSVPRIRRSLISNWNMLEEDIYSSFLRNAEKLLKISSMTNVTSIRRSLIKYKGETVTQTLNNITKDIIKKNKISSDELEEIKYRFQLLIDETINKLDNTLVAYLNNYKSFKLDIDEKSVIYNTAVHERTMLMFAENFQDYSKLKHGIKSSESLQDIIAIIYEKPLKSLH